MSLKIQNIGIWCLWKLEANLWPCENDVNPVWRLKPEGFCLSDCWCKVISPRVFAKSIDIVSQRQFWPAHRLNKTRSIFLAWLTSSPLTGPVVTKSNLISKYKPTIYLLSRLFLVSLVIPIIGHNRTFERQIIYSPKNFCLDVFYEPQKPHWETFNVKL